MKRNSTIARPHRFPGFPPISSMAAWLVTGLLALLGGCETQDAYQKAFSDQAALAGNSKVFAAPANQTLKVVKQTLVRQGFTIEQADASTGLIKAVRNYQDPADNAVSYNINATADVTPTEGGDGSDVTLAASQQTILHREWHDWWHLLWIIPLFPTGTEYQTVVTKEGNVTDLAFYNDFFAAVDKGLHRSDATPAVIFNPGAPDVAPAVADPNPAPAPDAATPQAQAPSTPGSIAPDSAGSATVKPDAQSSTPTASPPVIPPIR